MPSQFSLAKTLQYLFDEEVRPPWLSALAIIPLIVLIIWFMSTQKDPTKVEDTRWARQLHIRAIVRQKRLNVRGQPVLDIEQGTLPAEEIDWGRDFFSSAVTNDSFPPTSREAYLLVARHSLTAYAAVGDSLVKQAGDSSALVKRGKQVRIFYFRSSWP